MGGGRHDRDEQLRDKLQDTREIGNPLQMKGSTKELMAVVGRIVNGSILIVALSLSKGSRSVHGTKAEPFVVSAIITGRSCCGWFHPSSPFNAWIMARS